MRWLVSDWNDRGRDDLHDIDCGKHLQAIRELTPLQRMIYESEDMLVDFQERGDRYVMAKILVRRDPEHTVGRENYFAFRKADQTHAHRIPLTEEQFKLLGNAKQLTEEEFNTMLGLEGNPEDIFNIKDIEITSLDSYFTNPPDQWDLLFDANAYLNVASNLIENESFQENKSREEKQACLDKMANGENKDYPDVHIYSSRHFESCQSKAPLSRKGKEIAQLIENGTIKSKGRLWHVIKENKPEVDNRYQVVERLRKEAKAMKPGKERAIKMLRAQHIMEGIHRTAVGQRKRGYRTLTKTDESQLWSLFQTRYMQLHGSYELPAFMFEKMYFGKLLRKGHGVEEARVLVSERLEALYGYKKDPSKICSYYKIPKKKENMPEWLAKLPKAEIAPDEVPYQECDWLPTVTDFQEEVLEDSEVAQQLPE